MASASGWATRGPSQIVHRIPLGPSHQRVGPNASVQPPDPAGDQVTVRDPDADPLVSDSDHYCRLGLDVPPSARPMEPGNAISGLHGSRPQVSEKIGPEARQTASQRQRGVAARAIGLELEQGEERRLRFTRGADRCETSGSEFGAG